jgi:hypothetical protein
MTPMRRDITTSVLSRYSPQARAEVSSGQSQVDGLTASFLEQATDWKSLTAMMAGGLAYRLGKIGVMGLGAEIGNTPLRTASIAFGLASEVTAFEFTSRSLNSLLRAGLNPTPTTHLWRWREPRDGNKASSPPPPPLVS